MNSAELYTAIKDYCQNDETLFTNHLNDFIIAAEDKIFIAIGGFLSFDFVTSSIATVDGTTTYSSDDGIIDIQHIRLNETVSGSVATGGPVRFLLRKDIEFLDEAFPGTSASGREKGTPKYYAVARTNTNSGEPIVRFKLGPTPDGIYNMDVAGQKKISTDTITNGVVPATPGTNTTWLSITFPDVLMWGSIVQAYTFMKGEPDILATYKTNFDEGLLLLKNFTENRQDTDSYKEPMSGAQQGS